MKVSRVAGASRGEVGQNVDDFALEGVGGLAGESGDFDAGDYPGGKRRGLLGDW